MSNPLASIIIPCHNAEGSVGEAIRSALDQTYPGKEVIVVDDGSTDASLDILRSFGDRIRWVAQPNRGGGAARNRGLAMARGEFIQFLDADDALHPEKLERQIGLATRVGQQDVIVFCDYEVISRSGLPPRAVNRAPLRPGDDIILFLLKRHLLVSPPLHRKHLLEAVGGFDEDLPCAQEFDLHLRLACGGALFLHHPDVLFSWHIRPDSVSSNTVRTLKQYRSILPRVHRLLGAAGTLNPERTRALAELLVRSGRLLFRQGEDESGALLLQEAADMDAGAWKRAYTPIAQILFPILGPRRTERLALWSRAARRGTT